MEPPRLTDEQYEWLKRRIGRELRLLGRLQERMQRRAFPPHDRVYVSTCKAYHAVHELSVHLHYASCSSGTARGFEGYPKPPAA